MAQYDAFVLRVWRSIGEHGQQWAGRLEHVQRAESIQCTSVDALVEHLYAIAGPLEDPAAGEPTPAASSRACLPRSGRKTDGRRKGGPRAR